MVIELKTGRPKNPDNPDPHHSVLRIYSVANGKQISQVNLPADPVFDALADDDGKLFLALKNGTVVCYGG